MRSSGEKRFNNPKKVLCCNVSFLDDAVATYEVPKNARGSVLFQSVIRSLDLNSEAKYFGMLFTDDLNFPIWLDLNKKIKTQIKSEAPYKFEFRVKYYVMEPGVMLTEELTRYQFVLQIKQDLFQQRLSCTFRTLALLASYIVQSELGDYDPAIHKHGYLKEFKFVPNQPADLEREIAELHGLHSGLTPEDVEMKYLEKAKWLGGYGADMRCVRDCHGVYLKLGIAPVGLQVYQGGNLLKTFEWQRITKLTFKQKKFVVKVQPKEMGYKEEEHCFQIEKTKHCKLLWRICLEHHGFYKNLPQGERSTTLLRSTSQRDASLSRSDHATPRTTLSRSQPTTPHRPGPAPPPRQPTTTTPRPRDVPRDARRNVPDYARPRADYYHSLPRHRHEGPPDSGFYDKNITTSYGGYNTQANNTNNTNNTNKRSKSMGAGDGLDLDYPTKHRPYNSSNTPEIHRPYSGANYKYNYSTNDQFRSFFTDTVLQNNTQYNNNYGKSWGNHVNYHARPKHGSKSTGDVRMAASQPAFMTSSAMRQANFLMTTEL